MTIEKTTLWWKLDHKNALFHFCKYLPFGVAFKFKAAI
jgi:hypothetical protein